MNSIEKAKNFTSAKIQEHPELKEEIKELLFLFIDEVESGESPNEELMKMEESIIQLIEENNGSSDEEV